MDRAYVCVYRNYTPKEKEVVDTLAGGIHDPHLASFINDYVTGSTYYDWGDDPSFYSARCFQGCAEHAGWGVCRPDVRKKLGANHVVIFFCARREKTGRDTRYFFIGAGTVKKVIQDRREIWTNPTYVSYRQHYNVLARFDQTGPVQHETFYPFHENWRHRMASPYVLFDEHRSRFNLTNPIHVSTSYNNATDVWHSKQSQRVAQIEKLLFKDFSLTRRLRTSPTGNAHRHINLTANLARLGRAPASLLDELVPLV
ncbi:hypothetical protein [Noviherbaspirillum sp.]|uniref:hypothetical protein n=1 Tax=Noviherbaspirillum sp. TaxID=1926288 RepID=UPI002FE32279